MLKDTHMHRRDGWPRRNCRSLWLVWAPTSSIWNIFLMLSCVSMWHIWCHDETNTHTHRKWSKVCNISYFDGYYKMKKKLNMATSLPHFHSLTLSFSLSLPYLAYSVHMWIFVYRMLVWWPETISFCFASFNVSSNSGCFFSYVFFSPSNSDIHSLFFFPVYILLYLLRNALALGQSVYADPMA